MGTQGPGRKRIPNRDKLAAEEDALSQIAREADYQNDHTKVGPVLPVLPVLPVPVPASNPLVWSPQKYYGLDNKWGHIEQWMVGPVLSSRTSFTAPVWRVGSGSPGSGGTRPPTERGCMLSVLHALSRVLIPVLIRVLTRF
uniref:Uncharacterized protein n=1 Tax=Xiphophorus couchianus TaxID=32473 RepID=A0A3B5LTV5_9TELE